MFTPRGPSGLAVKTHTGHEHVGRECVETRNAGGPRVVGLRKISLEIVLHDFCLQPLFDTVGIADPFKPPFQASMSTVSAKKSKLGMRFK